MKQSEDLVIRLCIFLILCLIMNYGGFNIDNLNAYPPFFLNSEDVPTFLLFCRQ